LATPTRLSRTERRQRLLSAAHQLFGERGYRKTEIKDVVQLAGVTKPVLYKHFPGGKAEVFMAVIEEHIERLLKTLWEAMSSASEPRDRLHAGLHAYISFAEDNPDAFRLMANASPELDSGVGQRLRETRNIIARGLANTIADVMRGAGLPSDGAPIYAYGLLGGVESVVSWWLDNKEVPRDIVADYLLAYVWRGFDGLPRDPTRFHVPVP
jgi:AcrR family transcriptional regulator